MITSTNSHKIFDDYDVDCNTCESYWDNQCDGVKVGTTRNCTSYKATRKIDVLSTISDLKAKVKSLQVVGIIMGIAFILHVVSTLI